MLKKQVLTVSFAAVAAFGLAVSAAPMAMAQASAAKAGAQKTTDWTTVVQQTPEGGFIMGNPKASVTLIEFASLTCPHCRHFHEEGMEILKNQYIKSGKVRYEFRNFILTGPDYAASMLARCQGTKRFFPLLDAFFSRQEEWVKPFMQVTEEQQKQLAAVPQQQQIKALAEMGKLDQYVRRLGIPKAKFDQCLTDQAGIKKLADMRKSAIETFQITGTPSFALNGKKLEGANTWPDVRARLDAALK
ncbi:DsbA family protein [Pedomonas mirosovicensis]|uniref:DsbA family protein n=1 Tax=Pedomonas mirosovicensis TaxID=2908641 RepID=UPI002169C511|nr:DsbA family protein [Pedomonas mirosovicensis]MCH8685653.1 DsbA family protein [Pedomonas mirosovicensis]